MRRGITIVALSMVALVSCLDTSAEVRAVTDRHGDYQMTRVLTRLGDNVWTPGGRGAGTLVLNSEGAERGDLWPTIGESTTGSRLPWVLWSRHDGTEFNLAWSRWTGSGWDETLWLEGAPDGQGDDFDVAIDFDPTGRPSIVWWREKEGPAEVLLSVWMGSRWMPAFRVSDDWVDSRFPTVQVESASRIVVSYSTPDGQVDRTLLFSGPLTITDDINPLDCLSVETTSHAEEQHP